MGWLELGVREVGKGEKVEGGRNRYVEVGGMVWGGWGLSV